MAFVYQCDLCGRRPLDSEKDENSISFDRMVLWDMNHYSGKPAKKIKSVDVCSVCASKILKCFSICNNGVIEENTQGSKMEGE